MILEVNGDKYKINWYYHTNTILWAPMTECVIMKMDNNSEWKYYSAGIAKVHKGDRFVKSIGRKISFKNAINTTANRPLRKLFWYAYLGELNKPDLSGRQQWEAIPFKQFIPNPAMTYAVLIDNTVPMILIFVPGNPGHWQELDGGRQIQSGITHILLPKSVLNTNKYVLRKSDSTLKK